MILHTSKHRVPFQIDESDYEAVSQYRWFISRGYPATNVGKRGRKRIMHVHTFILGPAGPGLEWDHADRDKLNNQRSNLRAVTHVVNLRNTGLRSDNCSGVNGVNWYRPRNKWRAHIAIPGRRYIHIGYYDTLEAAAAARLLAEEALWHGAAE